MPLSISSSEVRPPATAAPWPYVRRALVFGLVLLLADRALDAFLAQNLRRYYGLDRPADVVCIGHSRTVLGIDEARLGERLGWRVAKYAVQGVGTADRAAMLRHALDLHPGIDLVVYDVEPALFADAGLSANAYRLFYPFMDAPALAAHVRRYAGDPGEVRLRTWIRTLRYEEATLALALRGALNRRGNLKTQPLDPRRLEARLRAGKLRPARVDPENWRTFEALVAEVAATGRTLVLVDMPTVDQVNTLQADAARVIRTRLAALADAHPRVYYLDLHAAFESQYALFHDEIHLNTAGKAAFTERLARALVLMQ